jgi:hypothetical protein
MLDLLHGKSGATKIICKVAYQMTGSLLNPGSFLQDCVDVGYEPALIVLYVLQRVQHGPVRKDRDGLKRLQELQLDISGTMNQFSGYKVYAHVALFLLVAANTVRSSNLLVSSPHWAFVARVCYQQR